MGTGMFVIRDDGQLVGLAEHPYDSEDLLQELLANYPDLLAGDQMDGASPRRWLLVSREVPIASDESGVGRWSLDHLFLDQDGIPTLIEVKRSSDTRIRREVVGQMLDYAANSVKYWPMEMIRSTFEARCQLQGVDADQTLGAFLGEDEPEAFWQRVKTNLQAGKLRLVFVADVIPSELQRIIEFLNGQMDPAEVLAVEIRQFTGENLRTLVPRVIGRTAEASQKKDGGTGQRGRQWDEASFMDALQAARGAEDVRIAGSLLAWAHRNQLRIWWGKGKISGSFFPMYDANGQQHWTISVWTNGSIQLQFGMLEQRGPFAEQSKRLELLARFNQIGGVVLPESVISKYPSIPISSLRESSEFTKFERVLDWILSEYRTHFSHHVRG